MFRKSLKDNRRPKRGGESRLERIKATDRIETVCFLVVKYEKRTR